MNLKTKMASDKVNCYSDSANILNKCESVDKRAIQTVPNSYKDASSVDMTELTAFKSSQTLGGTLSENSRSQGDESDTDIGTTYNKTKERTDGDALLKERLNYNTEENAYFESQHMSNEPSQKHRRAQINFRERKRMHDLNRAMESLREVMPYANTPSVRRLSKIATLSLARNYIQMLTKSVEDLKRILTHMCRSNPVAMPSRNDDNILAQHYGSFAHGRLTSTVCTPFHRTYLSDQAYLNPGCPKFTPSIHQPNIACPHVGCQYDGYPRSTGLSTKLRCKHCEELS